MRTEASGASSWASDGTLSVDDDGQLLRARSTPVLPLILAAALVLAAVGLVVLAIWDSRQPPSPFEREFPELSDDGSGIAVLVGLGIPLALGWAAFELWRSRRSEIVFDRTDRRVTVKFWWPIGPTNETSFGFENVTEVSLGGQLANRGGLLSTATVEIATTESHYRVTGWVALDHANRLQLQMLAALDTGDA